MPDNTVEMNLLTLTGSKSGLRTPLLGEAFLTSAINPGRPVCWQAALSAPMKSRGGGATLSIAWTLGTGIRSRISLTSVFFHLRGVWGCSAPQTGAEPLRLSVC